MTAPRPVPADVRRTVVREALVVVALTVLFAAASVVWDLPGLVAGWSGGLPVDHVVLVLAASHLLMMAFGARRGRQLKAEAVGRLAAEADLRAQAGRDPLTGLGSLPAFLAAVQAAQQDPGAPDLAVVAFDVDRFATVNDTFGHATGDALLVALAETARSVAPAGAVLARTGGDTFAVLLAGEPAGAAFDVAAALDRWAASPVAVGDVVLEVELSTGVAQARGAAREDVVRRASVARMAAKRTSAGTQVYAPELDSFDPAQLTLYGDLRRAVREGALSVHHQPKVRLCDGRVTGTEALVRWHHPERGLLVPGQFLAMAEQSALIGPLTHLVLDRALADCRSWRAAGRPMTVAVNVSPRMLHDRDFPDRVADLLRAHGVEPADLELEITETAALADPGRALVVLDRLRLLGVRLSVDDFGTGHASLTHLTQLPVTCLKIDRSFVAGMGSDPADRAIVRSVLQLAHALDMTVVAEGVETGDQCQQLAAWGCDTGQGWWFSPPVPGEALLRTVAEVERRYAGPPRVVVPAPRTPLGS